MKIYTKTGDGGHTGLFGGARVAKTDRRIEAIGDVDELNAVLGVARTSPVGRDLDAVLERIQHDLFAIGAELATPEASSANTPAVGLPEIAQLELTIDRLEDGLPPLKQFILPGGSEMGAMLHLARTVCRRAERRVVKLGEAETHLASHLVVYLNRLSDLLFVAARSANWDANCEEHPWRPTS